MIHPIDSNFHVCPKHLLRLKRAYFREKCSKGCGIVHFKVKSPSNLHVSIYSSISKLIFPNHLLFCSLFPMFQLCLYHHQPHQFVQQTLQHHSAIIELIYTGLQIHSDQSSTWEHLLGILQQPILFICI